MIDTFEIVEVFIEPMAEKSSLSQSSYEVGSTSSFSSSSASTEETTNVADNNLDPMYCIPLSNKTKILIDNMISDSFRNYRFEIREKYFDKFENNEQRYANPPPDWPDDQWRWIVDWWSTPKYDKLRTRGKNNCKHLQMLHTGGSESFEKKRYGIIFETGGPVNEVKFFIDTHTSKKTNKFVDEPSKAAAEKMEGMQKELTDEAGICSMGTEQIVADVLGPGSKGWERMHGRTSPKKKMKPLTLDDIEKIQAETRQQVMIQLAEQVAQQIEEATRKAREEAQKSMEDAIQRTVARMLSQLQPTSSSSQQVQPTSSSSQQVNSADV